MSWSYSCRRVLTRSPTSSRRCMLPLGTARPEQFFVRHRGVSFKVKNSLSEAGVVQLLLSGTEFVESEETSEALISACANGCPGQEIPRDAKDEHRSTHGHAGAYRSMVLELASHVLGLEETALSPPTQRNLHLRHVGVAQLLLEFGVSPCVSASDGTTALMKAGHWRFFGSACVSICPVCACIRHVLPVQRRAWEATERLLPSSSSVAQTPLRLRFAACYMCNLLQFRHGHP